ncbi:hypothetical protein Enr10x_26890 [Gimesia panareensis]|uniref:Uncharacterized protein n=1 Tax=Gimesia panareensis TaxID=2527978 RepID=A0A517Q6W4_9PLAN|nr:hypothetical protein Enr10x_26890 [Gimesia panareensis]
MGNVRKPEILNPAPTMVLVYGYAEAGDRGPGGTQRRLGNRHEIPDNLMLITETEGPGNLQNVCCFIKHQRQLVLAELLRELLLICLVGILDVMLFLPTQLLIFAQLLVFQENHI